MYEHHSSGMFSDRKASFFDARNQVIKSLSPDALQEFQKLDRDSRDALLDISRDMAKNQMLSEKSATTSNSVSEFKGITATKDTGSNPSSSQDTLSRRSRYGGSKLAKSKKFAKLQAKALTELLTSSDSVGGSGTNAEAWSDNSVNTSASVGKHVVRTTQAPRKAAMPVANIVSAGKAKKARALAKKKGVQNLKKTKAIAKHTSNATKNISKITTKTLKTLGKAIKSAVILVAKPLFIMILPVLLIVAILVCVIGAVVAAFGGAAGSDSAGTYIADVSELVRSYEPQVREACDKYGIPEYVELALAMIQQESSGNPPDIMQAEQSPYNKKPPIDSVEESIDCGIQELRDVLKAAKVRSPSDIPNISLAIQGYNYGNGYIAWALNRDGGYTKENVAAFSEMMKAKYGYRIYGDPDYVPHVMRYYKPVAGAAISNESAMKILKELMENNEADAKTWNMIRLGASLIGKTTYSMSERQDDGRSTPTILDCSSFTAWCFCKAKYSGIAYNWTTTEFRDSKKFKDISAANLQPGDIGLASKTGGNMGNNHVGIYCGELKDGRKVWMHCTSGSVSSLTGNRDGAMFGAYTGFTYFRRYVP